MSTRSFIGAWLAWSIIGFVHALSRYADVTKYAPNTKLLVSDIFLYVISYSFWVFITLALLKILKKIAFPFTFQTLTWLFLLGLMSWLPVYFSIDYAISTMLEGGSFSDFETKIKGLSNSVIFFYAVVYSLTFAACSGMVLAEKTNISNQLNASLKQQQTEDALMLSKQKMQLMQSQLSPHFLFNCLGAISGLARNGQRATLIEATARVGDLLRFTVSNSTIDLITIDEELGFIEDYIALQKLRFDQRFSFKSSVTLPNNQPMCSPFTIQPLIENVFCHAVETTDDVISIDFKVTYNQDSIIITICNTLARTGHGSGNTGTGLLNLKSRLAHLYGERYTLGITLEDARFIVELRLPIDMEAA